ncbi:MAG: hypothetical protein GXO47_07795 [Chlorobi bacterium]|nr:hypothetical protein [Chlorobiota bacterium]
MVIITFLKPNLVIHSDTIISGAVNVFDREKKHVLWTLKFDHKSYVSIKVKPDWPKNIEVVVGCGSDNVKKDISL